jgi:peptidoglycan/LPS O-acetylase OafA/YrhL
MEYRKDIQGLRALAIIFVFIFHLNASWVPGGFISVDIFFVLSGFLVSSIILEKKKRNSFSVIDFYVKRVRRIVPAYYLILIAASIAVIWVFIDRDIEIFRRELLHSIIFDADRLYSAGSSYFGAPMQQHPLLHTWSLGNEMKFYLVLPILLLAPPEKYRFGIILSVTIGLFLWGFYITEVKHSLVYAYYALPVRTPEFLTGVLLALKHTQVVNFLKPVANYTGYAGFILLCIGFIIGDQTHFPGFFMVLPCIATALLLVFESSAVNRLLSIKPMVYLGKLSYSVYLWHWPLIALMRYYYAGEEFNVFQYLFITVLTALLSWVSFWFMENKMRKANTRTFWAAMGLFIVCLVTLLYTILPLNRYYATIPPDFSGPAFGLKSHALAHVETFGDVSQQPDMVLIGNSHALCLKPYLDYIGKKNHFSFTTLTTNTYPPIKGLNESEITKKGRFGDYEIAKKMIGLAENEIKTKKVVIIALSSWKLIPSLKPAIEDIAKNLKPGQQLLLITPFPILDKNPLQVNRSIIKDYDKKQDYVKMYRSKDQDSTWLATKYSNVHFLNLSRDKVFKTAPFYNDTIMYYDKNHINIYGSVLLAKSSEAQFMRLIDSIK